MPIISPSIHLPISQIFFILIEMINNSDAGFVHIDVMDGVFVPNITFGIPIVKAVKDLKKAARCSSHDSESRTTFRSIRAGRG